VDDDVLSGRANISRIVLYFNIIFSFGNYLISHHFSPFFVTKMEMGMLRSIRKQSGEPVKSPEEEEGYVGKDLWLTIRYDTGCY